MSASVGDPITFMIRLTGTPPLRRIEPPEVTTDPRFTKRFRISSEDPSVSVGRDAKTVVRTIRARSAHVKEIPPLELAYFDTSAGEYRVARSKPVPLEISATREVTAADAIGGGLGEAGALEDRPGAMAPLVQSTIALRDMPSHLTERLRRPVWLLVLLGPMALYLAAAGVVLVRRQQARDPEARRRRRALARARRELRRAARAEPGQRPTLVSRALRGYIADRLLLPGDSVTTAECTTALRERGVDPAPAQTLLLELDRSKFGGGSVQGAEEPSAAAMRLLADLDRQLKEAERG
jgi:hypothetical protein